ncbi:hypothetical protein PVV74_17630 [Roseovarius sp. SK2]|uniref:hypothetical protein n=1 Tax=Roseovarius TaxID=74030 RepID=UPI00237BEE93|nr:hypothetical protein [Roseovarius sp. SK2]MDD9727284.1 hypothetical protein [Roseovarius sp. SK2]
MASPIYRFPEIQATMDRSLEAAKQFDQDAIAVLCWLDAEYPELLFSTEVQRLYTCGDEEHAHAEPRVTEGTGVGGQLPHLSWCAHHRSPANAPADPRQNTTGADDFLLIVVAIDRDDYSHVKVLQWNAMVW